MTEDTEKLKSPWLVAVWPGMGQVAINAGFYLAAKLEMGVFAEFSPRELFDVEHVDVQNGIIHPARLPRSRLFCGVIRLSNEISFCSLAKPNPRWVSGNSAKD